MDDTIYTVFYLNFVFLFFLLESVIVFIENSKYLVKLFETRSIAIFR